MIDVDAALRLLRNIVGEGLTQFDVGEWMRDGIAMLHPELDIQDFATLARIVSGEAISPATTVRVRTDQILPPNDSTRGVGPVVTEPPRKYVKPEPLEPLRWDVV